MQCNYYRSHQDQLQNYLNHFFQSNARYLNKTDNANFLFPKSLQNSTNNSMLLGLRNAHSAYHNGKKGPEKGICVIIQRDTTEIAIDTFHNRQVLVTFIFFLDSLCFWRFSCRLVFVKTVSPVFPYITYWSYGIFFRSFSYGVHLGDLPLLLQGAEFSQAQWYSNIPAHTQTPHKNT